MLLNNRMFVIKIIIVSLKKNYILTQKFLLFKKMKKKSQANETFVLNIRKSILRSDVVLWFVKINEVLYSSVALYYFKK